MDTLREYTARASDPADVEAAYDFCARLARRHYENFPVASRLLAGCLRRHVAVLYAFARIADDFSDEPEHEGFRRERLLDWRRRLLKAGRGEPSEHPVFIALARTLSELRLPVEPFNDLLSAFLQDVEKSRYANFAEVRDYCRRSAEPVGRIVLMIHGLRSENLFRRSDAICAALQLTNFWQDLSVDLRKDRIYLPQDEMEEFGYTEADLRMGVVNRRFRELMRVQARRTRLLFEEGRELPSLLPWPLSWEIRLTWLGGVAVLRQVRSMDFDTLHRRPALSKWDWIPLLARSLARL